MMGEIVHAPWSAEQVLQAEEWQRCGTFHPYTCGDREGHPEDAVLRATVRGWVCPFCGYMQDWAHDFTLNTRPPPSPFPEMS